MGQLYLTEHGGLSGAHSLSGRTRYARAKGGCAKGGCAEGRLCRRAGFAEGRLRRRAGFAEGRGVCRRAAVPSVAEGRAVPKGGLCRRAGFAEGRARYARPRERSPRSRWASALTVRIRPDSGAAVLRSSRGKFSVQILQEDNRVAWQHGGSNASRSAMPGQDQETAAVLESDAGQFLQPIFAGTESAARRSCDVNSYRSSTGNRCRVNPDASARTDCRLAARRPVIRT